MKEVSFDTLTAIQQRTLHAAARAMEHAYNPYSKFFVGAALHTTSGEIVSGANVENAAYGSCICAERSAIVSANAQGLRRFDTVAVIARGDSFDTTVVTAPCGECRQVLFEFSQIANTPLNVIMATTKMDKIIVATIEELLPLAFGPKDLGVDLEKYSK